MALKTFNLDAEVYKEFSKHCKDNGISMSKKVENFIRKEMKMLKSGEFDNFKLEIEKDTKPKIGIERPDEKHPMGKYC